MIKKYISKFTIDILPSIIATIVGAYIVTHYINPKGDSGKPAAAVASTPDSPAIDSKAAVASPAEKSPDLADAPAVAAPKAKIDKASIDRSDKDASPSDSRRHQPAREKAAKATPAPVTPAPIATPPVATASVAPAAQPTPDERRDANDLARAAIERLRTGKEAVPAQEAAKPAEPLRVQEAVRSDPAPVQQLPPPINVSTPAMQTYGAPPSRPSYEAERSEPRGPVPPGSIPSPPLDLQAGSGRMKSGERTNVAEDVLSAAKSVFNSVIPKQFER